MKSKFFILVSLLTANTWVLVWYQKFVNAQGAVTLPEITIYGTVPKPGQAYDSADDAGVAAIFFINKKSREQQVEYAGWIYQNRQNKKFYFTKPLKGTENDSHEGSRPNGVTIVGGYHTHGGRPTNVSVDTDEQFSPQDILKATFGKYISYLGTPKNKVLKFTPVDLLPESLQQSYDQGLVETLFAGN